MNADFRNTNSPTENLLIVAKMEQPMALLDAQESQLEPSRVTRPKPPLGPGY